MTVPIRSRPDRSSRSLTRAKDAVSGEGVPPLPGAVPEDSEEPQPSFMRSSGSLTQPPHIERDSPIPARMEPAFRGVAILLSRARLRRYLAEQNRAEDDSLPLALRRHQESRRSDCSNTHGTARRTETRMFPQSVNSRSESASVVPSLLKGSQCDKHLYRTNSPAGRNA